ncbi:MAG: bifunctional D-glycero-beta-D-manno-heptose-7-phosphate kinase/D-glycero-beta-D-manno-heptose 1-phosphate adenylyltransferase HldE [Gammaproteobacteria bacterium]|nr:bifunctional D-glycero-beta-D-manno-heptose-7-phosphate kinase/D-glycero-beta-D-manno-heptose 1-phosphate adenylyltransferase HldE [Gammaproteobacteria bacterium]NNM14247.1 bifunctional D-glycero-beta-D-manno-heptose-7-phosphate kinase/D-glycero-beta-D-manno-heptose 1-phosphate adenylyltransferase HldE [Gammaproteobacteria bacterium]
MSIRVPDFTQARILVIGDVMLDRYWSGNARRVSPEAPVPVVNIDLRADRLGGAANVASNVQALGAQTAILGWLGDDESGDAVENLLQENNIQSLCLRDPGIETITKLRVLSKNQQMIRLDFEKQFPERLSRTLKDAFAKVLNDFEVVIFSDYAKGSLVSISDLITLAKAQHKTVLVDPKGTDFKRYAGADFVTPNQSEFEAVAGPSNSEAEFANKVSEIRKQMSVNNLLVTRGSRGMYLDMEDGAVAIKSAAKEVHDVTGAGDTVIATLATAIASGESKTNAVKLANIAAGVVVGKVGTATLSQQELRNALQLQGIGGRELHALDELQRVVKSLQLQNKKIVMTNGCFDILHSGHIAFLEEAKAQGDYLLVAVNDDASVKRLKGPERPVNKLADRLALLAALSAVDWVLPFSEDTPQALIGSILPNILVKGGDYKVEEIAGASEVINAGGEVRILSFHAGHSTTRIIDKIRNN